MITATDIAGVLKGYDLKNLTIATLGGHSALDICRGAKQHGFKSLVIAQKGRHKTYEQYYKTRGDRGVVDEVIVLNHFHELTDTLMQTELTKRNVLMVQSRYFWVYCDYQKIEHEFMVPIIGSRGMVRLEERNVEKNQYYLLEKAGIRTPRMYDAPDEIDRLVIVKVNEAQRGYERAFFFADTPVAYRDRSEELLRTGAITDAALREAKIEEYIVGAHVNLNYYYSSLTGELELMGTDMRRQTNLDGFLRLPAPQQAEVLKYMSPKLIETGHVAVTVKESLLERVFDLGERFVQATQREHAPGMIGAFALQGAVIAEEGKEDIVIFDVSMRIPGSPGTSATPYTGYLYGTNISYGERIAMEVQHALDSKRLTDIVT